MSDSFSGAEFAASIRWWARRGWLMLPAVLILIWVADIYAVARQDVSVSVVLPTLITVTGTYAWVLPMFFFLRPRMLANADRIERWDQEQAEFAERDELRGRVYLCLSAVLESKRQAEYEAAAHDTLRIERELRGE